MNIDDDDDDDDDDNGCGGNDDDDDVAAVEDWVDDDDDDGAADDDNDAAAAADDDEVNDVHLLLIFDDAGTAASKGQRDSKRVKNGLDGMELYMNVERRESRFDPRGRFTTTPKMHKYDFLYKVLDSSVLEAQHRKSRLAKAERTRPKTSFKSPERAKSTMKSTERAKSSLVRSSVSPKRDRRGTRRVISPGPYDKKRIDNRSESRPKTERDDDRYDRAGQSFPRPNAAMNSDGGGETKSTDATRRCSDRMK
ncbi:hypothetical protein DPMN_194567 [Dreissena polymorpha]|uniref:Uncharacterized protein n=1 Tax=Dreissena polymorpha TaxID=45954 RepID=A0A9D4BGK9_DREPO|nr:hypothetical protein DPMN_194567 [Dreissena polymorpha]